MAESESKSKLEKIASAISKDLHKDLIISMIIFGISFALIYVIIDVVNVDRLEYPKISEVVIRVPTNLEFDDETDPRELVETLNATGVKRISLLVKQDEDAPDEQDLSGDMIPSGSLYYTETSKAGTQPDIAYDILNKTLIAAHDVGMEVYAWIPIFRDSVARSNNPEWALDGTEDAEYFIDPANASARAYEVSVVEEVLQYDVDGIRLDYVRYCDADSNGILTGYLAEFLSEINNIPALSPSTPVGLYAFPPDDFWWSGQNYTAFDPYLDQIMPMIYWQDQGSITSSKQDVMRWVDGILDDSKALLEPSKVVPTLSITDWVNVDGNYETWSESKIRDYLDAVFSTISFNGIESISLFYYGGWSALTTRLTHYVEKMGTMP